MSESELAYLADTAWNSSLRAKPNVSQPLILGIVLIVNPLNLSGGVVNILGHETEIFHFLHSSGDVDYRKERER